MMKYGDVVGGPNAIAIADDSPEPAVHLGVMRVWQM